MMPIRKKTARDKELTDKIVEIFDANWYLKQNPDIALENIDPLAHFTSAGLNEGRNPCPLFDSQYYLDQNPDIKEAGLSACQHFLMTGGLEGRNPHPLFDSQYYLTRNPDVEALGINPLIHFLNSGGDEGRNPCPLFDSEHYVDTLRGVIPSGMNPLIHYIKAGPMGDANPNPLFNQNWYRAKNPSSIQSGQTPLAHFLSTPSYACTSPHPLFDSQYYLTSNPDVQDIGINPLLHYLNTGGIEGRNPCSLFDGAFYIDTYKDVIESGINPLIHYLDHGARNNYQPNLLFDPVYYTENIGDFNEEGYNPLIHYIMSGPLSDAKPHPLFDQKWYRERNLGLIQTGQTPLSHFFTTGPDEYQNPNALFDSWYYQETYFDTNQGGCKLFQHYLSTGNQKGFNPNPYFLSKWYKDHYVDENDPEDLNLLLHYQQRVDQAYLDIENEETLEDIPNPNPLFDTAWYIFENQDVFDHRSNPLSHFIEAGHMERRKPSELFDPKWYEGNVTNQGKSLNDLEPLRHFLHHGAINGLAPSALWQATQDTLAENASPLQHYDETGNHTINPRHREILKESDLFDSEWYKEEYLIPRNNLMDPIDHYLIFGANLGYNPGPDFNSQAYRSNNHDLRNAAINPLIHYIRHGRFEGRHATKENRDNEIKNFRFSHPEYGPISDILEYDSDIHPPTDLNENICVHLHFYHADMAEEFCDIINRLQHPFTFLVSVQIDEDEEYWTQYFTENITYATKIVVKACPNRGRDVQPWLVEFKDIIRDHDIFCHLHTKKSGYNKFQKSWRHYLAHTTFGNQTLVNQILTIFSDDPSVGLIFPAYFYILRNQPNYGVNFRQYERLYTALFGRLPDEECPDYPAGSFFWARTKTLEPLLDLDLAVEDFDEEEGQVDGTIAHALERILGSLPDFTGHTKRCIAVDVPFDLTRYIHPARIETLNPQLFLPSTFNININDDNARSINRKPKVAVYTSITGGYENLIKPLKINPDIDYFLFTDTPEKFNPDWAQVIKTPYISHKPVRTARYAKTHAHFWFSDYDYAIWIDANVLPVTGLETIIEKIHNTSHHAGFIQHPLRHNCMEEGNELIKYGIDDPLLIEEQITRYGKIPEIFAEELIETNLFICRPKLKVTHDFMSTWWAEINNYSHRDQLSINYAIFESELKWIPLFEDNVSLRNHPDFFLLEHELYNREEFIEKITSNINNQSHANALEPQNENIQV